MSLYFPRGLSWANAQNAGMGLLFNVTRTNLALRDAVVSLYLRVFLLVLASDF